MLEKSRLRFRPFSHVPGNCYLLPRTTLVFQIFPSKFDVFDYSSEKKVLVDTVETPIFDPFTVVQNVERAEIIISGAYKIYPGKEKNSWSKTKVHAFTPCERLDLGCNKKMRFPDVSFRQDPKEIVPILFHLSQQVPDITGDIGSGDTLFQNCFTKKGFSEHFMKLYKAGFSEQLVPRLFDSDFHGFPEPIVSNLEISPLLLLKSLYKSLRGLFITEENSHFHLLPNQPFLSGKLSIKTDKGHFLYLHWTKGKIHEVLVEAACDDTITIEPNHGFHTFRVRNRRQERGVRQSGNEKIALIKNKKVFIDNFNA